MDKVEEKIERECCRIARQAGWVAVKMEKDGHKGIPDRLFLHPSGVFFMVEFKKDTKQKPRPEQMIWLERFRGHAQMIGSVPDFQRLLSTFL